MIKSYKDLLVWQKAHKTALRIFYLYKKAKKSSANYEIWKQCLRAAFSIAANIAEGYHSHRGKTFISKLEIARGEAGETDYWTLVLFEIAELEQREYIEISKEYREIILMLNSLIQKSS